MIIDLEVTFLSHGINLVKYFSSFILSWQCLLYISKEVYHNLLIYVIHQPVKVFKTLLESAWAQIIPHCPILCHDLKFFCTVESVYWTLPRSSNAGYIITLSYDLHYHLSDISFLIIFHSISSSWLTQLLPTRSSVVHVPMSASATSRLLEGRKWSLATIAFSSPSHSVPA